MDWSSVISKGTLSQTRADINHLLSLPFPQGSSAHCWNSSWYLPKSDSFSHTSILPLHVFWIISCFARLECASQLNDRSMCDLWTPFPLLECIQYQISFSIWEGEYVIFRHFLGFLSYTCLLFHSYYVLTFQTPTTNNLRNGLVFVLILTRIELIFFLAADTVFWI